MVTMHTRTTEPEPEPEPESPPQQPVVPETKVDSPPGGWQAAFNNIADALDASANGEPQLRWQTHLKFMSAQFRAQAQQGQP